MADERTALLAPAAAGTEEEEQAKTGLGREFLKIVGTSVPVILAYTLQNSLQTLSIYIVGRASAEALATAAFSYMFAMSTAWLIALGGTTALDTLCSVCFTSNQDPRELGVLLQRAMIVLTGYYVPVALLWTFSESVFLAIGEDAEISRSSARFLQLLIPGGLGYVFFESLKKYLQAQGIMQAGTYVLIVVSPLNALLNWIAVYKLGLGLDGAPLATGLSYWLVFGMLCLYSKYIRGSACWGGFSRHAWDNLGTMVRLSFMGIVHVGTEWWAFEIVALVAGKLGTIPLAAQSVIMTTDQVLNTIPFGIGVAASARVGNLLGNRQAKGAARAAHVAAWTSVIFGSAVMVIILLVRNVYGRIFSDDKEVIELVSEVMPYVAAFQIADGLNGSCGGALRGMGRQHIGALVNIVAYYMGALPAGVYLAFHGWGLEGLWIGQCVALFLVGIFEWTIVYVTNWRKETEKALERLANEHMD